jgi:hypothetical protein
MMLRRPLHPLAIALALVLAGTACDNDATGLAEPDEFLLFLSTRDGALDPLGRPMADIYRMDGDGSGAINLTGQPAWLYLHMALSPTWSGRARTRGATRGPAGRRTARWSLSPRTVKAARWGTSVGSMMPT